MTSKEFIYEVLKKDFPQFDPNEIINSSYLIQYLIFKMKSVSSSSKSRGSFGSIYPIFTLVEDYINKGFNIYGNYSSYEGALFKDIFNRQRELPFGEKLQNHGFNNRVNDDFKKHFSKYGVDEVPIIRNLETTRYWINENLLIIKVQNNIVNIAQSIINIVDMYIKIKLGNFDSFFEQCKKYKKSYLSEPKEAIEFVLKQLEHNVDARIFEIVSFVIVKYAYFRNTIFIGEDKNNLFEKYIELYKTGRTNANDGGIDFVMKPIGRFFQVTETLNFKKYFLDIDKLNKFPITFVVKSNEKPEIIMKKIQDEAYQIYNSKEVVNRYLSCFEQIISIPTLIEYLSIIVNNKCLGNLFDELILQCRIEYNIE